jgi:hypothetical protein
MNIVQWVICYRSVSPFFVGSLISVQRTSSNLSCIKHKFISVISELRNDTIFNRIYILYLKDHGHHKFRATSGVNP